jgi:excisionase family DNA binding protein
MAVHDAQDAQDEGRLLVQLSESDLRRLIAEVVERIVGHGASRPPSMTQYTVKEAADVLRCSPRHLRKLIAVGRLKVTRLTQGGSARIRIPKSEIERILRESTG